MSQQRGNTTTAGAAGAPNVLHYGVMRYGPVVVGLISAALFGVATPLSKVLLGSLSQFQLAGLLYLGAGLAMVPFVAVRGQRSPRKPVDRKNGLRLAGSVLFGGCMGPVFLLLGLSLAHASSVSLWLNLELAATAVLGYLVFRDHLDAAGWIGVVVALLAGVLVTVGEGSAGIAASFFVALACLCWGLDNNFTALIDALTPQEITLVKGFVAGAVNFSIGILTARSLPAPGVTIASLLVGALCYGGSIVLFIAAAQRLGAARSQIVFAAGPFFALGFSIFLLSERPAWTQIAAAGALVGSIALMLRARHSHKHAHARVVHIHSHRHDDLHHTHIHPGQLASLTHTHEHTHEALIHEHPHLPDLHHRHDHGPGS